MKPIVQRILTALITSLIFGGLAILGFRWWPAWAIAAALYAGVLLFWWHINRLIRKDREREEARRR